LQLPFGADVCKRAVDVGVPILIKLIESKETPEVICAQIKICPKLPKSVTEIAPVTAVTPVAGGVPEFITCPICKLGIEIVEDFIKTKQPIEKLQQQIEAFCASLPSFLRAACDNLENMGMEKLIELVQKETPEFVCGQIKMCGSSVQLVAMTPTPTPVQGFTCDMCNFVVGSALGWLESNATITSIEKALDAQCSKMGSWSQSVCEKFVDFTIHKLMDNLNNGDPSNKICVSVGACDGQSTRSINPEYVAFITEINKMQH
jgi:hypothetical protein